VASSDPGVDVVVSVDLPDRQARALGEDSGVLRHVRSDGLCRDLARAIPSNGPGVDPGSPLGRHIDRVDVSNDHAQRAFGALGVIFAPLHD